jgi:hypothetical protein
MGDFIDRFDITEPIYTTYEVAYLGTGEVRVIGKIFVKNPAGDDYPVGDPQIIFMPLELIAHIGQNSPRGLI